MKCPDVGFLRVSHVGQHATPATLDDMYQFHFRCDDAEYIQLEQQMVWLI